MGMGHLEACDDHHNPPSTRHLLQHGGKQANRRPHRFVIRGRKLVDAIHQDLRHDQRVSDHCRLGVKERKRATVLEHDLARTLPGENLLEHRSHALDTGTVFGSELSLI